MASSGFDLKQFLDDQRSQGETESEEGTFTVAQEKALTKLAQFALPGATDWVLKIVQAANAWGAPTLVVRQTREASSFFFLPPSDRFPSDQEIVSALTSGTLDNTNPVYMLCMALRSLVDQAKLSFALAICKDGQSGEPIYAGGDVSQLPASTRQAWCRLDADGLRLTVSHFKASESFTGRYVPFFSGFQRRDTAIASILEDRAYASTTAIILDGRKLTDPAQVPDLGSDSRHRALYLESWRQDDRRDCFLYPVSRRRTRLQTPQGFQKDERFWFVARTPCWRHFVELQYSITQLGLRPRLKGAQSRHSVNWILHGVVVGRSRISAETRGTTLSLFVSAALLRTDLSGLSVNFDEDALALEQAYVTKLMGAIEKLQANLKGLVRSSLEAEDSVPSEPSPDILDLQAGFSIYTTSLFKPFQELKQRVVSGLSEGYERIGDSVALTENLDPWLAFVSTDLSLLLSDLAAYRPVKR